MNLRVRWHTRQIVLEVFSYILCFTTALIVAPVAVQGFKFMEYGLDIYPGTKWPRGFGFIDAIRTFWEWSILPFVQWLPLTLVGDALLRRFVYGLRA
jgi:hypothetical protein